MRRYLVIAAVLTFVIASVSRAWDYEQARATGTLLERPLAVDAIPPTATHYQGRRLAWWVRRAVQARKDANARGRTIRRLKRELEAREIGPTLAIRLIFGERAGEALRVAWCESRWYTGATNGQFLGLFQMGRYARSTYGHGASALEQAQAAHRYFVASGSDWSPWSCRP